MACAMRQQLLNKCYVGRMIGLMLACCLPDPSLASRLLLVSSMVWSVSLGSPDGLVDINSCSQTLKARCALQEVSQLVTHPVAPVRGVAARGLLSGATALLMQQSLTSQDRATG